MLGAMENNLVYKVDRHHFQLGVRVATGSEKQVECHLKIIKTRVIMTYFYYVGLHSNLNARRKLRGGFPRL